MSKVYVKSSFMSPVQSAKRPQSESRVLIQQRVETRLAKLDAKIRKALRRGDLDSVESMTRRRNNLFSQVH